MSFNTKLIDVANKSIQSDLPLGVYVVQKDGTIVDGNKKFRKMLNLPLDGDLSAYSLASFYRYPEKRKILVDSAIDKARADENIENTLIELMVEQCPLWVNENCSVIWEDDSTKVTPLGFLGCMMDITKEEEFRELLPTGLYELDANDNIVRMNRAILDALGYDFGSLRNKHVTVLHKDDKRAKELSEKVKKEGKFEKEIVELTCEDGSIRTFWASAYRVDSPNGYGGRKGTLVDITEEEKFQRLLNLIPIGAYSIKIVGDREYIEDCNKTFALMFDFDSPEDAHNTYVFDLWENPERDSKRFREALGKSTEQEPACVILPVKTKKGRHFLAEIHGRLMKENGRIIGRSGALRDASKEAILLQIREDVGKVTHAYQAALVMWGLIIKPCINYLKSQSEINFTDPLEGLLKNIQDAGVELSRKISRLIEIKDESNLRSEALSENLWENLKYKNNLLIEYATTEKYRMLIPAYGLVIANEVINILRQIKKQRLPDEITRKTVRACNNLILLCILKGLLDAKNKVDDMEDLVKNFRAYVEFYEQNVEEKRKCSIKELIETALKEIGPFASSSDVGIEVDYKENSDEVHVYVEKNNIVTAIYNLLHNAVKYSWRRTKPDKTRVKIITIVEKFEVCIYIENLGVPIKKDEIESDAIFVFGIRGELSSDRKRKGSGWGLPWARQIVRAHRGDIQFISRPEEGGKEDDYLSPFVTIATLRLPLS